ncbi:expansin-A9 [Brachypodium distachyon]|uniref:Expansin n=1 Tax=Brachypodium distachyon TaxID=15368 RepID=I1HDW5_BRADI|nr:expansin-A9 [Brachypodium distachyon]KQK03595.1 hypothetical protein BRADI_2g08780v3 [Brachypodium distachyon]|eukprot:XP_003566356.1 expansin-A9 [Brachypodium distachyon]
MEKTILVVFLGLCVSQLGGSVAQQWIPANATFYGGSDGSGAMGGSCGYGDLNKYNGAGYGTYTTALSATLYGDAKSCGACYAVACDSSKTGWCKPGASPVTVTATDFCPPNWSVPSDGGGWCNPPRQHFDMSQPAWEAIAVYQGGFVPVKYARAPCRRTGGIRFSISGNDYFELVLISNVAGSGAVSAAAVKGSNTDWMPMSRNWGSNWQSNAYLTGQSLSFQVQTDDGRSVTAYNVAPPNWQFGNMYESSVNFW